ncbi:MAG: hypothetical protein HC796_08015, partial [Synechococcaceae cyanobacterium RL_1_2]|nr:hypothetical protein [Synechococcaceae cyanobacterium RL_1_2]
MVIARIMSLMEGKGSIAFMGIRVMISSMVVRTMIFCLGAVVTILSKVTRGMINFMARMVMIFYWGGLGSDRLKGAGGNDTLDGYGFGESEADILLGGAGADIYVLGNLTSVYYDKNGRSDSAVINGFERDQDVIRLHKISDVVTSAIQAYGYELVRTDQGTEIQLDNGELIGLIRNQKNFSLTDAYFEFVDDAPQISADLVMGNITTPDVGYAGTTITTSAVVTNKGQEYAPASKINYWLSDSPSWADQRNLVKLGTIEVGPLDKGASTNVEYSFDYDINWGSGRKYIIYHS